MNSVDSVQDGPFFAVDEGWPAKVVAALHDHRRVLVFAIHIFFVVVANYLAFFLRFDGSIPTDEMRLWLAALPVLIVVRASVFWPFRMYSGLWRYTGISDLRNIVAASVVGVIVFRAVVVQLPELSGYPKSIFILDSILLVFLTGGIRLVRRISHDIGYSRANKRILIYGAGDAGEMIVRDMKSNSFYDYRPIGFVDDDPRKTGQHIHGVSVLGTRDRLPEIIAKRRPDEVLVAMPRADAATLRRVLKALEPFKVPIKTLPNLRDLLDGKVAVSQMRDLSLGDLLARAPIGLNPAPLKKFIQGTRVMITGAGGSIGSELARQVAALNPSLLLLYERHENSLYALDNELRSNRHDNIVAVIGDVADASRVEAVFAEHRPQTVFHAAAHKHVPLMEFWPCEAVKNNISGTRTMAEAADRFKVERFILISTDKAVNPTSVMGATKRVCETLIAMAADRSRTCFATVRFGNVLGSNGSVALLFLDQIRRGGPVTVTHPEMRRFFMVIPEAVQLVLHAATIADAGALYVLEMGEQIKIIDMARHLIRLAGFIPGEEIPIAYIGLRPGEKLSEQLVEEGEAVERSAKEKILVVRPGPLPDSFEWREKLAMLEQFAQEGRTDKVLAVLGEMVPSFGRGVSSEKDREAAATLRPLALDRPATPDREHPLAMAKRPSIREASH